MVMFMIDFIRNYQISDIENLSRTSREKRLKNFFLILTKFETLCVQLLL